MYFTKALLVCASFAVATVAQTTKLAFTNVPTSATAGSPTTLKWTGGDGTAVTIILQQGSANNLQTVSIVTGSTTGNSFTWTPDKSLSNGDNYALKITQGTSEVNYSGMFTLSGGSSLSSSSSSSMSSTSSSSSVVTPVVPVPLPSTANTTSTSTVLAPSYNATTTAAIIGTGIAGTASAGTGIPMSRNTTMSMATLTPTATTSTDSTTTGASTTSSKAASATSAKPTSSATNLGSPLAFVFCAFIAIAYLG